MCRFLIHVVTATDLRGAYKGPSSARNAAGGTRQVAPVTAIGCLASPHARVQMRVHGLLDHHAY